MTKVIDTNSEFKLPELQTRVSQKNSINSFDSLLAQFNKLISERQITVSRSLKFSFETREPKQAKLDPYYIRRIFDLLGKLQAALSEIVLIIDRIPCREFFMFYVNRLDLEIQNFMKLHHIRGKTVLNTFDFRRFLMRIQVLFLKVLAIYELFSSPQHLTYPSFNFITQYLENYWATIQKWVIKEAKLTKKRETLYSAHHKKVSLTSTELTAGLFALNQKLLKTIFSYYVIYRYGRINFHIKQYISKTLARLLLYIKQLHERIDIANLQIYMNPWDLLQILTKITNKLRVFHTFVSSHNNNGEPLQIDPQTIEEENQSFELFSSRKCIACRALYNSPLWVFIQQLANHLHLRIKLIDSYYLDQKALTEAIYEIPNVPAIKYKDRFYIINVGKERGLDLHATVKRELLDFFEQLGLYCEDQSQNQESGAKPEQISPNTTQPISVNEKKFIGGKK